MEANSPGQRLYMIRLACGDGVRKPLSLREFVELVEEATGVAYDHKTVSLLERDQQGWRLKDMETFAAVDPKKRGAPWLGFGVTAGPMIDAKTAAHRLSVEEEDRAIAAGDREEAEEAARQRKAKKAAGKGKGPRGR